MKKKSAVLTTIIQLYCELQKKKTAIAKLWKFFSHVSNKSESSGKDPNVYFPFCTWGREKDSSYYGSKSIYLFHSFLFGSF